MPVNVLASRTEHALLASLPLISGKGSTLILHLSHYGFAKRGAPLWLARGIKRWVQLDTATSLIVIFHELYAFGPPWRSSFWLLPVQKSISRNLLKACQVAVTTTERSERILRCWRPSVVLRRLPVFSLVGEPEVFSPPDKRANVAIVFGRAGVEDTIYGRMSSELAEIIEKLKIDRIIDVGPRSRSVPIRVGHAPIDCRGVLPANAVSEILRDARYGLLAYPPALLGKSSIFAAYAAHGVLPILLWPSAGADLGHVSPVLFANTVQPLSGEESKQVQCQLLAQYKTHCIANQVNVLKDLICNA